MDHLTAGLREKFQQFHEVYEYNRERLTAEGIGGALLAGSVWVESLREIPLGPAELRLYKQLVALHSVNGGELFADE